MIHIWLYMAGSVLSLALLAYKGFYYVLVVRSGQTDLGVIASTMFAGSAVLRGLSYGVAHLLMGSGLAALAISIWMSLTHKRV